MGRVSWFLVGTRLEIVLVLLNRGGAAQGRIAVDDEAACQVLLTLPWRGRVDRAQRERGGVISPLGQSSIRRDRHPTPSHASLRST